MQIVIHDLNFKSTIFQRLANLFRVIAAVQTQQIKNSKMLNLIKHNKHRLFVEIPPIFRFSFFNRVSFVFSPSQSRTPSVAARFAGCFDPRRQFNHAVDDSFAWPTSNRTNSALRRPRCREARQRRHSNRTAPLETPDCRFIRAAAISHCQEPRAAIL